MIPAKTFFGLEITNGQSVRLTDIVSLPFAGFWQDSAVGSGQLQNPQSGDWLIHLHDWKAFALLFIATGRHRNMHGPPFAQWYDRDGNEPKKTYFGLEVQSETFVCKDAIMRLPFSTFWRDCNHRRELISAPKNPDLVYLDDWKSFATQFIDTGQIEGV